VLAVVGLAAVAIVAYCLAPSLHGLAVDPPAVVPQTRSDAAESAPPEVVALAESYTELPRFDAASPFADLSPETSERLASLLRHAAVAPSPCESAVVGREDAVVELPLESNICDPRDFASLVGLLRTIAPSVRPDRLGLWKTDLGSDGTPELVLTQALLLSDGSGAFEPMMAAWLLRRQEQRYAVSYLGAYLAGRIHGFEPFGGLGRQRSIWIRWSRCTDCEATELVTIATLAPGSSRLGFFEVDYGVKEEAWTRQILYQYAVLDAGQRVVDGVEAWYATGGADTGPHLIQRLREGGEAETWWVFSCRGLRCAAVFHGARLPGLYRALWNDRSEEYSIGWRHTLAGSDDDRGLQNAATIRATDVSGVDDADGTDDSSRGGEGASPRASHTAAARHTSEPRYANRSLSEWLADLEGNDARRRRVAIGVMGELGPAAAGATASLVCCLEEDDPSIRLSALHALARIGEGASAAVPAVLSRLRDPEMAVSVVAARTLAQLGDAGRQALIELLRHDEAELRYRAVQGIVGGGPPEGEVAVALEVALEDSDLRVRALANVALAGDGRPRSARRP